MLRTAGRALLVLALATVGVLPAASATGSAVGSGRPARAAAAPAAAAEDTELSVEELDLDGVRATALADLPDAPPVPPEDVPDAAAEPGTATAPTPGATEPPETADASPTPTSSPTGEPSPTPATGGTAAPPTPGDAEPDPDVLTTQLSTDPFVVFGVTWDPGASDVVVRYRVREQGRWSAWEATGPSDVAPDANRAEGADETTRGATDPIVTSGADGVQVWVESPTSTVSGVKVVLIDPGTQVGDSAPERDLLPLTAAVAAPSAQGFSAPAAGTPALGPVTASAPAQPGIISRSGWGADESMRTCSPEYSTQMVTAAVHHTASANGYSPEEVPGIIRGFYAYHTLAEANGGRGWCDLGYNFLVDRFGRVFEGRAGGITATVVGVHTGGFNSRTIGIAAIGEYGAAGAPDVMTEALAGLIAWKFSIHGIYGGAYVDLVSGGGASKYPEGTVVTFPTIYGHRDAQLTSCPGENLYRLLPYLRTRVAELANATVGASPIGRWDSVTTSATSLTVAGWAADPETTAPVTVEVRVDGALSIVVADQDRPDVGAAYPALGSRHGFSLTIPRGAGTAIVCLAAGNLGSGTTVSLGCRTVTVRNAAPLGSVDAVVPSASGVTVSGWALDPDTSSSNDVHVYIDGVGVALTASTSRPDVAAVYGKGDRHGFSHTRALGQGQHEMCVYSIDTAGGANTLLTCRSFVVGTVAPPTPPTPPAAQTPPVGVIDAVDVTNTGLTVWGWAFDPDTADPIDVHIYIDGVGVARPADGQRADVGAAFGRGPRNGYSYSVKAAPGRHDLCVHAINSGPGGHTLLGCRSVDVPDAAPIGVLDLVQTTGGELRLAGWTLDPDTWSSNEVHVYVDGRGTALTAGLPRADVAAVFGRGDKHGFTFTTPLSPGEHGVCVYGINTVAGANTMLLCSTVVVTDAAPVGVVDSVRASSGALTFTGWAFDPDSWGSTDVHLYVDGVGTVVRADQSRPDVGAVFGRGDRHGFSSTLRVGAGSHAYCVHSISSNGGVNTLLTCGTVSVP